MRTLELIGIEKKRRGEYDVSLILDGADYRFTFKVEEDDDGELLCVIRPNDFIELLENRMNSIDNPLMDALLAFHRALSMPLER